MAGLYLWTNELGVIFLNNEKMHVCATLHQRLGCELGLKAALYGGTNQASHQLYAHHAHTRIVVGLTNCRGGLTYALDTSLSQPLQAWPLTGGVPGKKPQIGSSDLVVVGYAIHCMQPTIVSALKRRLTWI
jgi:hypothetical protein